MKKLNLIAVSVIAACLILSGCGGDQNAKITNGVKTAATFAIQHVPSQFQTQLANYLDVAAKGVYSIDGTPTVNEVVTKVMSFIPEETQKQFPFIGPTISTAVSFAYVTYGKPGLTAIGQGLEAAAAPYHSKT